MSLRPAHDKISLERGPSRRVRLRASLRAASDLERNYGFDRLFRQVDEFHYGTVRDVIMITATDRQEAAAFLEAFSTEPLTRFIAAVRAPVADICRAFIPQADQGSKPSTGKPMTWQEVYRELYRTAAGCLGWTPDAAWRATPIEINEAFTGHIAMLKIIHGSADDQAEQPNDNYTAERLEQIHELGYDPAFDRAGLAALKAKIAGGV
ncbi:phage tail assembly chaperone [Rhizobium sp. TH2]|uniref:hypothetical protein n=1 Tax=Rhizobium sp. TH2 TaxID=2775403 RepID=UPI0021579196|nr:hypothetical protein [Rhizobium sp. TH2]UVC10188.1 phage tail assembly chaperone [Rhizobium sp. TH2]